MTYVTLPVVENNNKGFKHFISELHHNNFLFFLNNGSSVLIELIFCYIVQFCCYKMITIIILKQLMILSFIKSVICIFFQLH